MQITPAKLSGVHTVQPAVHGDERGYLVRTYCGETFRAAGLGTEWTQGSLTYSPLLHTLRGMHFQKEPCGEVKLIRCVTGKIWDCLVDLRPASPTHLQWEAFELSEENALSLYVPDGIAHGFLTLTPDVRMLYSMSAPYSPGHASGVRWNDPAFRIAWPHLPVLISERDAQYPDFQ
ncbi:MAG: dTDP-4-dehydrorhamnose 3,5-epimerase [Verrucomicrobiales bacterium]|nr:dTDP-4-dehydrorhamnose 3,5-epimerase [Verrucomicrobiales bacterium]